jgi:hypothetical protein
MVSGYALVPGTPLKHAEEMLTLNVSFVNYVELLQLPICRGLAATCGSVLCVFRIPPSIKLKAAYTCN